jgi:hypothetical protein
MNNIAGADRQLRRTRKTREKGGKDTLTKNARRLRKRKLERPARQESGQPEAGGARKGQGRRALAAAGPAAAQQRASKSAGRRRRSRSAGERGHPASVAATSPAAAAAAAPPAVSPAKRTMPDSQESRPAGRNAGSEQSTGFGFARDVPIFCKPGRDAPISQCRKFRTCKARWREKPKNRT